MAGGNESLNKEEFDEGVMYRYTIKNCTVFGE